MLPDALRKDIDAVVSHGITHIGFIAVSRRGEFLVRERPKASDGVLTTWPKLRIRPGEAPSQTLERCLRERVGSVATSAYPISTAWATLYSTTLYFIGLADGEAAEHARWCSHATARRKIFLSWNPVSRRRDLAILRTAAEQDASPERRVLLMLRELHRLGYERLRATPSLGAEGWQCPVVPASWALAEHGGLFQMPELAPRVPHELVRPVYSSATGQYPFGWDDAAFDPPAVLARKFVDRAPSIAQLGRGKDAAYARWFRDLLKQTAPAGLFYATAEGTGPADGLYPTEPNQPLLPLPPPGELVTGRADYYHARR